MPKKKLIDLLIANGTVVTVYKHRRVIRNGAVAISKNKIIEVGKSSALRRNIRQREFTTPMKN